MMPAITLDPDGLPVIAYLRGVLDPVIGNLQERTNPVIARCHDATCASITKATVGEALRWYVPAIVVPSRRPARRVLDGDRSREATTAAASTTG